MLLSAELMLRKKCSNSWPLGQRYSYVGIEESGDGDRKQSGLKSLQLSDLPRVTESGLRRCSSGVSASRWDKRAPLLTQHVGDLSNSRAGTHRLDNNRHQRRAA